MIVQKFLPYDPVKRLQLKKIQMLSLPQGDLAVIITSDEANFHLDDHVPKQNYRYKKNPRELLYKPLHSQITVWCTLSKVGIICRYFL